MAATREPGKEVVMCELRVLLSSISRRQYSEMSRLWGTALQEKDLTIFCLQ